ncbi:MAG: methyl-accepting chemotaxis protein [Bacillota bacterium]
MKKQLIIILSIVIIVPLAILGFFSETIAIETLRDNITENTNSSTIELTDGFDKFFEGYNNSLIMLSQNKDIQKISSTLTSKYKVLDILDNYLTGYSEVMNVYVGTENGNMHLMPKQELPEDFDPRNRSWYKKAKGSKDPIWTKPYADASSGDTVVTGAIPLYNNDDFVGVIGVDINITSLSKEISSKKIGKNGYVVLVDKENNFINHPDESLVGKPIPVKKLAKAVENNDESGVYYNFKGNDKYIYFKKMETTGWKLLGARSDSDAAAEKKLLTTILIVAILSVIGAIIIGITFSNAKIVKPINNLSKIIDKLSNYDLRFDEDSEAVKYLERNDEIGDITKSLAKMQKSFIEIIKNVSDASENVSSSSEELTAMSNQSKEAANEVAQTIQEIANGANDQAKETSDGAEEINNLGQIINSEIKLVKTLDDSAKEVDKLKEEGFNVLANLEEKTKANNKAASEVQDIIIKTNKNADKIESASGKIQEIAEQTNLLALNASIEAARAGEAGKGFAVVADEIRNLAEETNDFASQISSTINTLSNMTDKGVKTMEKASKIVVKQSESLDNTNDKFEGISNAIERVKKVVNNLNASTENMTEKKTEIINIIENLSAISEENAAGTEEASASVQEQTASMEQISEASESLAKLAEDMQETVSKFEI